MNQWQTSWIRLSAFVAGVCLFLATSASSANLHAVQDLPGENELPLRTISGESLPDEAKLPGTSAVSAALLSLPAESVLPPNAKPAVAEPDPLQLHQSDPSDDELLADNDRPILKLQLSGPTAPVRTVRFSDDSSRILAGGDDKVLHVWSRIGDAGGNQAADGKADWVYQQAVNWQIYRGSRGSIYSIVAFKDWIMFAGLGATPESGEVALVNGRNFRLNRCLFDFEKGSKLGIGGLVATGPERMAAIDFSGRITSWNRNSGTGQWEATLIRQSDSELLDAATSNLLGRFRRFGTAIAASSNEYLFFARPRPRAANATTPQWDLVRHSLVTGQEMVLDAPAGHLGGIPAIGTSADGNRIVSADFSDSGRIFVWDLSGKPMATISQMNAPVRTISVSPSGKHVLIGTANSQSGESQAVLWRWEPTGAQVLATWQHSGPILGSCISPDEKWLAYTLDNSVVVKSLTEPETAFSRLESSRVGLERVAFAESESDGYRILLKQRADGPDGKQTASPLVFDPGSATLEDENTSKQTAWRIADPNPEQWRLVASVRQAEGSVSWNVEVNGRSLGTLPLDSNADGMITCSCWMSDPTRPGQPLGLAVGTNKRSHLYVYQFPDAGSVKLVRQYRGHESAVRSVSVSADRRYLVSSSDDSTVRFWKLDDAIGDELRELTIEAWGARFQIEANRLMVKEIFADSPLYSRDVRAGDSLDAILWRPANQLEPKKIDDPAQMLDSLRNDDFRRMLRFEFSRNAVARPQFYLYPAWQPLASLVVTDDREWAFWSPYGYYDASFNGHKHFGWQINRGIDRPPDFFRAAEMKEELERPVLMKRLLQAGSMEDAFLALRRSAPSNLHDRLAAENRLRPHIEIVHPTVDVAVRGNETDVEAVVKLPLGVQPVAPKAFANGVPASKAKLMTATESGDFVEYRYRWRLPLPGDHRIRIQVIAGSQHGSADVAQVDVNHEQFEKPANRKLYLIAAGINRYADSQIPQLEFAVNNVAAFQQVLSADGQPLYELDSTVLLENSANRPLWGVASDNTLNQLRATARPDDLLVIFLSGHGVSDPQSDQYYFVTSSSRFVDLLGRQYGDCIALEDFARFGDIPCRKLVILDTCESGSFRATDQQNLQPLVRALESDLFFTITASEGSANAYESKKDQLSFFTASLVAGMGGAADLPSNGGNNDRRIGFAELVSYVTNRVPAEIASIGGKQYPGAAPKELFDFAEIPLTVRGAESDR